MSDTPELVIVKEVTWEHAETFAETWRDLSLGSEPIYDAFQDSGVMTEPDDPELQGRFADAQNEILTRVFDAIRYAATEAFFRIANEVLARERGIERGR
jgi:hypothetical protein